MPPNPMVQRMYIDLPGLQPFVIPSHTVAGILWLDKAMGIADDCDYVLVSQSLAGWLMVECDVLDPAIQVTRMLAMLDEGINEKSTEDFIELISNPFAIRFSDDDSVPSNIRGEIVSIAVMKESDMENEYADSIFAVSMHADDSFVGPTPAFQHAMQEP